MTTRWDPKDPDERLDYDIDWSARLDPGDSIVTSTWFIALSTNPDGTQEDPTALTLADPSVLDAVTKIWIEAGTLGVVYSVTNRIVTAGDRIFDWTQKLKIKTR